MKKIMPDLCPACGSRLHDSADETEDDFAFWEYDCGAKAERWGNGRLYGVQPCDHAFAVSLRAINDHVVTSDAAET
ncbi:hypothetical protein CCR97_08030 [Rhodoplanes elegans]|uniref:Uncharacterized protein n=1 Tax=Rhodoplanes elegans TaxID=29408 RepID=A0A327KR86_9BRAD|nr:hypothetical protein [Rhodoplanes elegans]MBK5958067.1 hypothetical protein [Rhodoplanes elegans]MBK5958159.1 hypothetical protein [Rhodoplanes elegans]RAI40446.1 hypothetical protein CH338_06280 [Rhodoplanes elegans]